MRHTASAWCRASSPLALSRKMTLAAIQFVEWLASMCDTSTPNIEVALKVSLLAGLLIASIHFVTMIFTRWGDSDPTSKAFMFSMLLHLSLAFGTVAGTVPESVVAEVEEPPVEIRELILEGEEKIELDQSGNTRIREDLLETDLLKLARIERAGLDLVPLEAPDRRDEPVTQPDIELPDILHTPDALVARPNARNYGQIGPQIESAAPQKVTESTAEARPEVNIPTPSPIRRRVKESGLLDTSVDRRASRGTIDQVAPDFAPDRTVASLDLREDPAAFLKQAPSDSIRRRSGPSPTEIADAEAGSNAVARTDDTSSGALGPRKFSRRLTRTPKMEEFGGAERFRPDRRPFTPDPVPDVVVAVRTGPTSLLPIDGPQPNVIRPNLDPINSSATTKIPPTYRLRSLARRTENARKYGGTEKSERAVESSLEWLAMHQSPDGYWDADGFSSMCPVGEKCAGRSGRVEIDTEGINRRFAGLHADPGVTGLTVLAFLGAGYTHEEGQYADHVDRALSWLIRQQEPTGFMGGNATRYARTYCHAIATYAMAEALGMQSDRSTLDRLRRPLERAVGYIVSTQNEKDGGWRYLPGQQSDMSIFGWQLMALKSADIAGIPMPPRTRRLMIRFLKDRSLGDRNGLAAYRLLDPKYPPLPPSPSMTAESLFCKQMLGLLRDNPQSLEAVEYLRARPPQRRSEDLYYWYYGTLAMYQYGGQEWNEWNAALSETLVADQRTTGHAAGSWDPHAPWGAYGGRVFSTALSTLCLEVYYRFLPLYQIGDDSIDTGVSAE